jgi:transcriptional regulator GlxA family with amidase domain
MLDVTGPVDAFASTNAFGADYRIIHASLTGADVVASSGARHGADAGVATHWKLARQLASRFPEVVVDSASLFVTDGPFVTSAGVTAGIDLTLSLIEHDHGPAMALDVARDLVVFMAWPGDQSQFSVRLDTVPTTHSVVRDVMDSISADPTRNHTLASLADGAGVSTRHLSRLFLAETGRSPM